MREVAGLDSFLRSPLSFRYAVNEVEQYIDSIVEQDRDFSDAEFTVPELPKPKRTPEQEWENTWGIAWWDAVDEDLEFSMSREDDGAYRLYRGEDVVTEFTDTAEALERMHMIKGRSGEAIRTMQQIIDKLEDPRPDEG